MKTTIKVDALKFGFIFCYLLIVFSAVTAWADGKKNNDCGDSPFKTSIIKFEGTENCYDVILDVSFDRSVTHELSHVNFDFGCGVISNEWNSQGWKMESNHIDPTTGLGGIKIDDISSFGKDEKLKSFRVKFTFCPSEDCDEDDQRFSPKVAYKAGQCIYYESPSNQNCNKGEDTHDDNESDDDHADGDNDDSGSDGDNDDDDGDHDSWDDSENTSDGGSDGSDGSANNDNPTLTVAVNSTDPTCMEPSSGIIWLVVSGGTEPYEYTWNNSATSPTLTNLTAGTYSFSVIDADGDISTGELTLGNASEIVIASLVTNPDCQGIKNGSISLEISGGTQPYNFSWNNGSSDQNISELAAYTYLVTVKDINGCQATSSIPLYNETSIFIKEDITQPSCQLGTSGSIGITSSGGTEPLIYSWSNGEQGSSIEGLSDGTYDVTVTDQNGCSNTKKFAIITDVEIEVTSSITKTNCFNEPIGGIDLSISGGIAPYTVEWPNGEISEDLTDLIAGNYTAMITDALGCQTSYKASILEDDITISYKGITIPSCNGNSDGAISISVSNATDPYSIEWSNGSNEEDQIDLSAGVYHVKVTDEAGCISERSFTLPEPNPLEISHIENTNQCTGTQDVVAIAQGGSLEYNYLWSDGSTSNEIIDAAQGIYSVTVTDTRGCAATQEIIVEETQGQQLECLINSTDMEVMCGSTANQLSSNLAGAISYSWSVASSDESWMITSAIDQSQIVYAAGAQGSSAIFKLAVQYEGGCEVSCDKIISVCTVDDNPVDENPDNPNDGSTGGENPDDGSEENDNTDDQTNDSDGSGGDDQNCNDKDDDDENCNCPEEDGADEDDESGNEDGSMDNDDESDDDGKSYNDKSCTECFSASPVQIEKMDEEYHYTLEIGYEDCRYDLSHLTIDIPSCFEIIDYSNSMNWKMAEVNSDPTTGLSGLKVDNIPSFGKDPNVQSFSVSFVLTSNNEACMNELDCFAPIIAYKSATCVYQEVTTSECYDDKEDDQELDVSTYPNPTCDFVKIDLKNCDESTSYIADIYDFNGEKTYSHKIEHGSKNEFIVDLRSKKQGLYLLRLTSNKGDCTTHRIIKY